MCSDAFPAGLPLTLRKGVGRSFMSKGDGKDGYKRADKEKTGTDIWELARQACWVCSVRSFA